MNAKEAREQSLWNSLNSSIRRHIIENVNNGYTSTSIYHYRIDAKNRDILIDLGYSITYEGGTTIVKW